MEQMRRDVKEYPTASGRPTATYNGAPSGGPGSASPRPNQPSAPVQPNGLGGAPQVPSWGPPRWGGGGYSNGNSWMHQWMGRDGGGGWGDSYGGRPQSKYDTPYSRAVRDWWYNSGASDHFGYGSSGMPQWAYDKFDQMNGGRWGGGGSTPFGGGGRSGGWFQQDGWNRGRWGNDGGRGRGDNERDGRRRSQFGQGRGRGRQSGRWDQGGWNQGRQGGWNMFGGFHPFQLGMMLGSMFAARNGMVQPPRNDNYNPHKPAWGR